MHVSQQADKPKTTMQQDKMAREAKVPRDLALFLAGHGQWDGVVVFS